MVLMLWHNARRAYGLGAGSEPNRSMAVRSISHLRCGPRENAPHEPDKQKDAKRQDRAAAELKPERKLTPTSEIDYGRAKPIDQDAEKDHAFEQNKPKRPLRSLGFPPLKSARGWESEAAKIEHRDSVLTSAVTRARRTCARRRALRG